MGRAYRFLRLRTRKTGRKFVNRRLRAGPKTALRAVFSEMEALGHPFAGLIVKEKGDAGEHPGDGVDDGNGEVGVVREGVAPEVDETHDAGKDHRDGGGDHRVADAAHGGGEDLDEREEHIAGSDERRHLRADGDDRRIVADEEVHHRVATREDDDGEERGGRQVDEQPLVDRLVHALTVACAEVLPDVGHDGDADGVGDGPVVVVELVEGGPARHGVRAEHIDADLQDDVGNAVHRALKGSGDADVEHPAENAAVKLLTVVEQTLLLGKPPQGAHDQRRAHDLRKSGRGGGSLDAPLENDHKEQVERNVGYDADEKVVKRALGVSHRAQDAAAHVVEHGRHHAEEEDAQIGGGGVECLGGGLHPHEQLPRGGNAEDREKNAADHREQHGGADAPAHALRVPCTEVLCDDDARARRERDKGVDEQIRDAARRAAD